MTEIWDLLVFEDLCLVSFLSCSSMHEETGSLCPSAEFYGVMHHASVTELAV